MMNIKFMLIGLLCMLGMTVQAQTATDGYRPTAKEDKYWKTQIGVIQENVYFSQIEGDTLINGESWKKVYNYSWTQDTEKPYFAAIRDVEQKVYAIAKGSNRPRLLYDFSLKVGDLARCGLEKNDFGCLLDADEKPDTLVGYPFRAWLMVERIDTIRTRGQEFRYFTLRLLDDFHEQMSPDPVVWVEGIGSGFGLFSPWMPFPTKEKAMLTICKETDDDYFSFPDDYKEYVEAAAGYYPFLKEGKEWFYQHDHVEMSEDFEQHITTDYVSYKLKGDTVIDGKDYMKMYFIFQNGSRYMLAMREENKQVFMRLPGDEDKLLFDFGMQVGESYEFPHWGNNNPNDLLTLESIRKEAIRGRNLIAMKYAHEKDRWVTIVEGVGSTQGWKLMDQDIQYPTGAYSYDTEYFLYCAVDDKIFATVEDIGDIIRAEDINSGIPQGTPAASPVFSPMQQFFDLQGRRLQQRPQQGVYIQNGRKQVVR